MSESEKEAEHSYEPRQNLLPSSKMKTNSSEVYFQKAGGQILSFQHHPLNHGRGRATKLLFFVKVGFR
jgi:hypothetical protein